VSRPSIALVLPDDLGLEATVRCLSTAAIGIPIHAGRTVAALAEAGPGLQFVLVHAQLLGEVLQALAADPRKPRIGVLAPETTEELLEQTLSVPQIVGLVAWTESGARSWELLYLTRRLFAPQEEAPHMGALLAWGATTLAWTPRTTEEQRQIVQRIDTLCSRLGIQRQVAELVSTAAHELLMNAMYDAPVDAQGRPRYASDRTAAITLAPHEVPSLRFTVDGEWLALDAIDPFGRIPRSRFFEGVLRGQRAMRGGEALDTSHGGAGLGLHTLYTSGAVLRVELVPTKTTHVSWALDRTLSRSARRRIVRSLYFLAMTPRNT
jgi:hypothetical protein